VAAFFDGNRGGRRRDTTIAGVILVIALLLFFLPAQYQSGIRQNIRGSVFRPLTAMQVELVSKRNIGVDADALQAERDSLYALVAAQAPLTEENRRLRALLGLQARAEPHFIPAEVIRVGLTGAESTFLINAGSEAGVVIGSPVVGAGGLLGVVWEVDRHTAHAIDWTHPEFRVSAMAASGDAYGIVEPRRGRFREEDLMVLSGAPFHSDIRPGERIVTSGRGGIYPRGIPIGIVLGIEDADTGWRKSYLLRPAARPEAVTHALVAIPGDGPPADVSQIWHVPSPADTLGAGGRPGPAAPPARTQ
jgi:rod shape-determining protein MreC